MKYLSLFILVLFSLQGFTAQTGRIFVTNENGNSVTVIDGKTSKVEGTIDIGKRPRGIGLSPDAVDQFAAVHQGIISISNEYKEGVAKCRILTGTDTRPCTDFESCQRACYAVTSFCLPVALGAGRTFVNVIWGFENDSTALDIAYAQENSSYAVFSSSKTKENMAAYLSSLKP